MITAKKEYVSTRPTRQLVNVSVLARLARIKIRRPKLDNDCIIITLCHCECTWNAFRVCRIHIHIRKRRMENKTVIRISEICTLLVHAHYVVVHSVVAVRSLVRSPFEVELNACMYGNSTYNHRNNQEVGLMEISRLFRLPRTHTLHWQQLSTTIELKFVTFANSRSRCSSL